MTARTTTVFTHDRLKKPVSKPFQNKPKRWSHQVDLEKLKGGRIVLFSQYDAQPAEGQLIEADQFTIKILLDGASKPAVFFKHSLAGFAEAGKAKN